jgi:hypothetical protein
MDKKVAMQDTLDNKEVFNKDLIGERLTDLYRFWMKRRVLFNVLVGLSGFISLMPLFSVAPTFCTMGTFGWGLIANGLYCVGYSIDSFLIIQSKGSIDYKGTREILFWLGTIAYCIVSYTIPHLMLSLYFDPFTFGGL